jgi:DNA primase
MRIPDDKIEEVRNAVDILELIGNVVSLKKAGKNFLGLCPFHQEKTPSFTVNPEKQMYKCFGCGEGGNIFTFIMKEQNLSFIDTLRQLAQKSGIALPRDQEDFSESRKIEKLYTVNEFAARWYSANMYETKNGKKALDYLLTRGFKEKTLKDFLIGYAPDDWEELVNEANRSSFERESLVEAGLALRKSAGSSPYDRFRNRIIFPISNEYGRIVGFGAREFEKSSVKNPAKYINTPETPIYHKGRLLYGLFQNKDLIRKRDMAILVEGYTDVMSLTEHGIGIGIATLGTAVTPRQAQLISRYTRNVVVLYDADAAGVKAALRGSEVLLEADIDVEVVNLGDDADPDSFLRNHPRDDFIKAVENRKSIIDFYVSSFVKSGQDISYSEKTGRIRSMIELVDSVKDTLKRELMLKEIGEKLSTDIKTIFKDFYNKKRSRYKKLVKGEQAAKKKPQPISDIDWVERELGSVIVNSPDLAFAVSESIEPDFIRSPLILRLFEIATTFQSKNKRYTTADLVTKAEDKNLQNIITELAFDEYEFPKQDETEVRNRLQKSTENIIVQFKKRKIVHESELLQQKIKEVQAQGEDALDLITQSLELQRRIDHSTQKP